MHALNSCSISAACFSTFIAVPTNPENFKFFLHLFVYFFELACNRIATVYSRTIENMLFLFAFLPKERSCNWFSATLD